MYEMVTGKVPFDADTPVSVALKHMQEEPKAAIEINPTIPLAVNNIIMKALKKETNLRYQNATAMLLDLKRALKDPSGDFVDNGEYVGDFPTQRISTLGEERGKKSEQKTKKQNKFIIFIKKHKVLSSIVGLCLLFAISLGGTIGIANARRPKEVLIPNLVGKTVEEAKQILEENKLKYIEEEPEYNTEYEAGQIISQTPQFVENRKIKQNTEIKVVVSLGIETTTVPKLKGLTKDEAEEAAKEAKIKLEIIEETSKTVEAGIIIKQEVAEGESINAGETVKVYLSVGTGIKQVIVTSVLYKDEETAKQTLAGLGLDVAVEYDEDKTRGNGVVLKQSISSGETVDEGTKITITVNKLVETKSGKLIINVKALTGFKDKITTTDEDGEKVEKENTPKDVSFKVTVNDEQVTRNNETVKENETKKTVNITGKGTVQIKIWIDGALKGPYTMNLNDTAEMTIDK